MTAEPFNLESATVFAAFVSWRFCGRSDTTVEFHAAEGYHFSPAERRAIESVAANAATDARRVLPTLPHRLLIRVLPGTRVVPETGDNAEAVRPDTVTWIVD